jgi:hypothetical protein
MKGEIRQEASIPVQTRANITCIAELDIYWMSEGKNIKSMSQLIGWSLELLCEILKVNERLPKIVESVAEAHRYIDKRGLYQPSLKKRSFDKISTAIRFEGMREEGTDPGCKIGEENANVVRSYNIIHNKNSIQPFNGQVVSDKVTKAIEIYNKLSDKVSLIPKTIADVEGFSESSIEQRLEEYQRKIDEY